jgi:Ca-activated chloride channel family protein
MRFESPYLLLIMFVVPLFFFFKSRGAPFRYSSLSRLENLKKLGQIGTKPSSWQASLPIILKALAIILIVLALAKPQAGKKQTEIISEGVDIILTIDTSGSMNAVDFSVRGKRATRLAAVKEVVAKFIEKRPGDRIGMVVFGEEAFTQAPLTLDHELLLTLLDELTIGMAGQSTAVGQAMAVSVNRLKDLKAKSKVIILLTDGVNNAGNISPVKAAEIAKTFDIKVYTIGVGTTGPAPFVAETVFGKKLVYEEVMLDEKTLRAVAKITDARYFHAIDTKNLVKIYDEIDDLEKTEAKVKEYMEYRELFFWFLIPGILLLLLEMILVRTRLRKIP